MEVSAKTNENQCVNEAIMELLKEIKKDMKGKKAQQNEEQTIIRNQTIDLIKLKKEEKKKGCC